MQATLTLTDSGDLCVTDDSGYPMIFDLSPQGIRALTRVIKARNKVPEGERPRIGEPAKPSAVQILAFMREKKQAEVKRKADLADEILDLIDLDLDL